MTETNAESTLINGLIVGSLSDSEVIDSELNENNNVNCKSHKNDWKSSKNKLNKLNKK